MTRSAAIWIAVAIFLGGCLSDRKPLRERMLEADAIAAAGGGFQIPTKVNKLEQALEKARLEGIPIIIDRMGVSSPNSAGRVGIDFKFYNTSNETIKYLYATFKAYNAVGDPQGGEIYSSSTRQTKVTGPVKPNGFKEAWGGDWYNYTITCARLTDIKITYMNGKTERFNTTSITNYMRPQGNYGESWRTDNSCTLGGSR